MLHSFDTYNNINNNHQKISINHKIMQMSQAKVEEIHSSIVIDIAKILNIICDKMK